MSVSTPSDKVEYSDELSPREWWVLLVRQRAVAAGAAAVVALGGIVVSATAVPLYQARARVVVAAPVSQPAVAGELPPISVGENTATQVELLLSEGLLERARKSAGLEGPQSSRYHVRIENTPGSDVIDVVGEGPRGEGAAALANALIELHVSDGDQARAKQIRGMMAFLVQERTTSKNELDRIDRRLKVLREREKRPATVLPEKPGAGLPQMPAGTETPQLAALRKQIQLTSGKIAQARRELQAGSVPTGKVGVGSGSASVLPDVWSRLTVLEDRLRKQTEKYRQFAQVTTERVTALRLDAELRQLQHRREAAQAALRTTSERLVELRARGAAAIKPFRSVEPAPVPPRPFWPDPRVQFSVTLAGAVVAGVLAAVVRERRVARVQTADHVERLGLSLLGTAPGLLPGAGPDTEASWQELLDGLEFAGIGRSTRVLMVLPVAASTGGKGLGRAVARALAGSGRSVGWVDADLRPHLRSPGAPVGRRGLGLSQVLAGIRSEDQVLEVDEIPNLWRLAAGPPPPNPLDLLGSQAAGALLGRLGERFEMVIVDAHPCLDRPDALRLVPKVEGVLLAADCGRLRPAELGRAAELVRQAGGNVVGVVLEEVRPPAFAARREEPATREAGTYRRGERQDERS